jgi:hypothetical protein
MGQVISTGVLQEITHRAGLDCGGDLGFLAKTGQDQDAGLWILLPDSQDRLQAGHVGHRQVHEDDVWFQSLCFLYSFQAIRRLANHGDAVPGGEQ